MENTRLRQESERHGESGPDNNEGFEGDTGPSWWWRRWWRWCRSLRYPAPSPISKTFPLHRETFGAVGL